MSQCRLIICKRTKSTYESCAKTLDAGVTEHHVNYDRKVGGKTRLGQYHDFRRALRRQTSLYSRWLTLRVAVGFVLGGCASDANVQAIGTREQDEAQTPCCYPHFPDGVCVRYVRAFTTQRGVPSRWHRRCWTTFLISITVARSSHPPISDRLTARRGRARHYS